MSENDIRILLVTAPPGAAPALAEALLDAKLAACVNLVPGVRSLFWWQGAREEAAETLLVLKTPRHLVARATAAIVAAHPYEVPEVLVIPVEGGHPAYLDWVRRETERP